jgi:hypothetical protein
MAQGKRRAAFLPTELMAGFAKFPIAFRKSSRILLQPAVGRRGIILPLDGFNLVFYALLGW